jgi:hypothetical protein
MGEGDGVFVWDHHAFSHKIIWLPVCSEIVVGINSDRETIG